MAQANRWLGRAHWVSIAFPIISTYRSMTDGRRFAMTVLEERGIGTIVVNGGNTPPTVNKYQGTRARMLRRPFPDAIRFIRNNLKEEQRSFAQAGSRGGAHWTPYKQSCIRIEQYVRNNNGCGLKEVIDELGKLHYANPSSARHSLSAMARGGHIPGVVARKQDGKLRLFTGETK